MTAARLHVLQLRQRVEADDAPMESLRAEREATQRRLEAAHSAAQALDVTIGRQRREAELELARLEGQLAERRGTEDTSEAALLARTEFELRVVRAAEELARQRRDRDQSELLTEVSAQVAELGRQLGVAQLEQATLKGNAQLPVFKGGKTHTFSDLTDGERLRLKIAVVIALLRVGARSGVGRHPGLLIIDSLGREEVNPDDLVRMLQERKHSVASRARKGARCR